MLYFTDFFFTEALWHRPLASVSHSASFLLYLRYFALLTLLYFTTGEARRQQPLCLDVCEIVRKEPFELILLHMLAVYVVCSSKSRRFCVSICTFVLSKASTV